MLIFALLLMAIVLLFEFSNGFNDCANTDTVYMLKMREIYRHLSNAADRGDEAANIIGGIVVKMA